MKFCVLLPFKGEKGKSRAVVDEVLTVRRSPDDYLSKSARLLLHTYLSNPQGLPVPVYLCCLPFFF